jgi:hypothetical protein
MQQHEPSPPLNMQEISPSAIKLTWSPQAVIERTNLMQSPYVCP